ncbi:cleavage polyadenylation factor RNA-binding subunit YTH1 KNAG_0A07570 [Huiozyma naganishii CBS 8797]|uniref:mRNA 3'-end-processing protein n=1 Tax=Huiozyma naganishii (strain ATCC MYA-139 / BCRC 22969 / CBS 8797 / KCTC 17520 / NBRC 10181 / NCYC 3082 / Yp74L-3) TaxID=1071383 RepID=J7R0S0_HUIN7|nr:hypothetical protein KNAG_0A07570 [Kazachstania naganishii CBS 8797]CCK68410.1 hypothetical protein KNAG_0A07570 [Kazachstania naganishii CBS 8797]
MSVIHPPTDRYQLKFEPFLRQEYQFSRDPDRPVCPDYDARAGVRSCPRGSNCPMKHILPNFSNKIVCKHWLRGLCKKNDQCEYLHEYNLRRMPECVYFAKNGYCTQSPDCQYLHVDPQSRIPRCEYYDLGFCSEGAQCKNRHVKKNGICQRYLNGFCPVGRECSDEHPAFPDDALTDVSVRNRVGIKKDYEINTRKMDLEKERRLNAIINGDIDA